MAGDGRNPPGIFARGERKAREREASGACASRAHGEGGSATWHSPIGCGRMVGPTRLNCIRKKGKLYVGKKRKNYICTYTAYVYTYISLFKL